MTDTQIWALIIGVLAFQPALMGAFGFFAKGFIDAKFEAVDAKFKTVHERMDAKFETVNVKIDHLDRDVQALARRVMDGDS